MRGTATRLGASLVVLAGLAVAAPGPSARAATPPPPSAAPSPAAAPVPPATGAPGLRLRSQSTWVEPTGTLSVEVDAVGEVPDDAELAVTVHARLQSRSLMVAARDEARLGSTVGSLSFPLAELGGGPTLQVAVPVQPGTRPPSGTLRLPADGVYPLRLELRSGAGDVLAGITTFVVRLGPAPAEAPPLSVALVVPFGSPPALGTDGRSRLPDDELARLASLASGLARRPVPELTLVPTPETVAALGADDAGAGVLSDLAAGVATRQVVATPYVDVDLTRLLRSGLRSELDAQFSQGAATLGEALSPARPDGRTWLGGTDLGGDTVGYLRARNVDQLVLPDAALSPVDLPTTLLNPTQLVTPEAPTTTVASIDQGLSAALDVGGDPVVAANHLLAELAQLFHDRPSLARGVVMAAGAGWDPDPIFLDAVLVGLGSGPLLQAVSLDDWFLQVPLLGDETGATVTRSLVGAPQPPDPELAAHLIDSRARLAGFTSMLGDANALPATLGEQLLVAMSARLDPAERMARLDGIDDAVGRELAGLEPPVRESVTLTSRQAEIPIWLSSTIPYPVTVLVRLDSDKLGFPEGHQQLVTLEEGRTKVEFTVRARASGTFPLDVSTRSPDGRVVLGEVRSTVRSTAVSGVGVVLSIGAVLVLAAWWVTHLRTTRRHPRHARSDD